MISMILCSSPVQPDLECSQGWSIYHLSCHSVPVFHHSIAKKYFLTSSLNLPSFSLKPLPLVKSLQALLKSLSPSFLYPLSGTGRLLEGLPWAFSSPGWTAPTQPFLKGELFHPSEHFCGPPLDPLQQVHSFPVLRAPELDTGLQQSGAEGQKLLKILLHLFFPYQRQMCLLVCWDYLHFLSAADFHTFWEQCLKNFSSQFTLRINLFFEILYVFDH